MINRLKSLQILHTEFAQLLVTSSTTVSITPVNGRSPRWIRVAVNNTTSDERSLRLKPFHDGGTIPADSVLTQISNARPLILDVGGCNALRVRNDSTGEVEFYFSHLENT